MVVITDDEISETRRYEVLKQIVRGKTMPTIAEELGVSVPTVYKDFQHIRLNARDYVDKFTSDIIPIEIMKCLTRVNMVSDELWKLSGETKDERVKVQALVEAKKAGIDIVNLITNNKDLVDIVYEMKRGSGNGNGGNGESNDNNNKISLSEVKKQRRLPGSVVKEFQEAIKRQEHTYESEYKEQSEDEADDIPPIHKAEDHVGSKELWDEVKPTRDEDEDEDEEMRIE
jgi:Homeodomain-like domain-containing protein